ncbi:hypothetical protein N7U66_14135 [Lacinutrix neustonica]|uniref:Uncharacterized protein n=1 Tax=Lacinutrix neustonica TaxID=2980107 RepID=A0A9E8SD24_9FLAO|nr:hypothetical protein [Lacinutrix neustonica]WAC01247.1 hypothetical protein N7U66_14135 [Lacinutrix neustonica]
MIVNPPINSLRLVLVPLTTVLLALGYYSYESFIAIEHYEKYLFHENELIAQELGDMILSYHDLEVENDAILNQLNITKTKIFKILDSIQYSKPDVDLVTSYKKQLLLLKEENKRILNLVKALDRENDFLKMEVNYVGTELEYYKSNVEKNQTTVSKYKYAVDSYKRRNLALRKDNRGMTVKLDKASKVLPSTISVSAVKRLRSNNIIVHTTSARRTKKLNICFTLPKNTLSVKGKQTFYLQVIDPNNNVVGDLGDISLGEATLIASKIVDIDYDNENMEHCEFIEYSYSDKFTPGLYYIGIYTAEGLVINTSFTLN